MKIIKYLSFVLLSLVTASAQARFLSVDPVGFKEGNPMSFNRYAYANNNPYKYVDPDGREVVTATLILVGAGALLATHNAQAPTSATDMHPNMDTQTIDAVAAAAGVAGIVKFAVRGAAGAIGRETAENGLRGVDDLIGTAGGQARNNGDIVVSGGRDRAKELFREFDIKGKGNRTITSDKTGGGRGVAGEMGDGTALRIRMKLDGTTRMQAGDQKFIFPNK